MKLPSRILASAVLIGMASLAIGAGAQAHGIYFAQRAKQTALIYGIGSDDLDMVKRMPLLESITAYDSNYQPIKAQARVAGPIVLADAEQQPTLLAAVLQNGIWSRDKDGEWQKMGRDEMPDTKIAEKTVKYTVSIQGPLEKPIPALPTQTLQIVPVGAIPTMHGAMLTYRVLYMGKPLAGARIINDMINDPDAKEVKTAADGTITLPVRNQGLNIIRAVYDGPTDNPKRYDRIEHTATLAFTLPHAPE